MKVVEIRRLVYNRAEAHCERCGELITWEGFHMHEVIPRGKGGKISLDNSIALCSNCHIGRTGIHGNRRPRWKKIKLDKTISVW